MIKYHVVKRLPNEAAVTDEPLYICSVSDTGFFKGLYFVYLVIIGKAGFSIIVPESFLTKDCTPTQRKELLKNVGN